MLTRSSVLRRLTVLQPNAQVGVWGDKLERKDNVAMRLFGISKKNDDNFAQPIYEDYKKSGNTKFFPPAVMPRVNGEKLTPSQQEKLEVLVGQARKDLVRPYINNGAKLDGFDEVYKNLSPEQKLEALNILYEEGFNNGRDRFIMLFPEFAKPEKSDDEADKTESKTEFRESVKGE